MIRTDEGEWYSASDLLNWLDCHHRTTLDARALDDAGLRAFVAQQRSTALQLRPDGLDGEAFDSPAAARGDMHERAMLAQLEASGHRITPIARPDRMDAAGIRARAEETAAAMRGGADVIFQATLLDAPWYGFADFLVRVDGVPSDLGAFAYEVRDTKLARHPSARALLQMAHYGAIVEQVQGRPPVELVIWLGTGEEFRWPFADAAPYLHQAQQRYLSFRAGGVTTEPDPVAACPSCRWEAGCREEWGGDADLLTVHRLSRRQRLLLRDRGITTVQQLAASDDASRPARIAPDTFDRLREQAAVQVGDDPFALIRPQPADALAAVPAPDPGDIYFDLEGDPFAGDPTLDYLWAYCDAEGEYVHRWAHTLEAEREAFLWFLQLLRDKEAAGGEWRVYHYNTYEITSLTRVARHWPDEALGADLLDEVTAIIERRFVDLYRAVESGLRTRDGSTSLKIVEKLAGYERHADDDPASAVAKADDSIVTYERYVMSTDDAERADLLEGILVYNRHDVRATRAVHPWLHGLAAQLTAADLIAPPEPYVPSDQTLQRIEETRALRDRLFEAADSSDPLPSGLRAEGARMLARMLEWHRAEMVVQYIDKLRLKAWALAGGDGDEPSDALDLLAAELNGSAPAASGIRPGTEHESCLLDVEFVREIGPTGSAANAAIVWEYRCRPGSWKIRAGKKVEEVLPEGADRKPLTLDILDIDPEEGVFRFSRRKRPDDLGPLVLGGFIDDSTVWNSLMRLGSAVLEPHLPANAQLAAAMLDRTPPLPAGAMAGHEGEDAGERARRVALAMDAGLLPVQGPPGTGKTWTATHLIADAIRRGGRDGAPAVIAVTAHSHKVIDNLLVEAARRCREEGLDVTIAHVGGTDAYEAVAGSGGVVVKKNGDAPDWLADRLTEGRPLVIGATKFLWSRGDMAAVVDLLVIDEAGQLTLADSLSLAQCSARAIALGDPQQLSAPVQAAHHESVDVSLLEHLAQGRFVLPPEVGVFLDVSYRMHPTICRVVGDLAYDGALEASESASSRDIAGPDVELPGQVIPVRPGVVWVPLDPGEDEVDTVSALLDQLVGHATVTLEDGTRQVLDWDEVRVVAPHNAHVNRLAASLPDTAHVGTVDRFQGQQGHVVVLSMGREAESPGDVPFLYELNRINVALSRARLMVFVVSSRDATFPPVAEPEHLMLASRFSRAIAGTPELQALHHGCRPRGGGDMTRLRPGASGFGWGELPLHADAIEATGWGPVAQVTDFVLGKPGDGSRMAYPGERPPGSFVVDGERVLPVRPARTPSGWIVDDGTDVSDLDAWLAARGEPALTDRLAAVGYGSNLNPSQVTRFSLGRAVVVLRGVTVGLASAFCNTQRGDGQYPAGITAHDPSRVEQHGLVLIDLDQQGRLDGKEGQGGTYDRSVNSGSSTPVAMVLEDGTLIEDDLPVYLQTEERPLALWSSEPVLLADVDQMSFRDSRGDVVTDDHGLQARPVHRLPRHDTRPVPVFVYGTLRPGQSRWPALADLVESHEPAWIHGHRFDTGYGFPGLILDHPQSGAVDGDLLHLAPGTHLDALALMDRIEGHPDLYARHLVRVSDGRVAWVYLWNGTDRGSGGR